MNIFIVGLRRSGTTSLFDIFHEDVFFKSFYEPLSISLKTKGGGSMNKDLDYNERIRNFRNKYSANLLRFHFGAPKNFKEEAVKHSISKRQQLYLKDMIDSHENTILKFVRTTHIIETLFNISPNSYFLHIKKNPLRFAISHLFGLRDSRLSNKSKIKRGIARLVGTYTNKFENTSADKFFSLKTGFDDWSQESIINEYIANNDHLKAFEDETAVVKLLLLWKEFNTIIEQDGKKFFGEKFLTINHENLCLNTHDQVKSIYSSLGLNPPEKVLSWAEAHIIPPRPIFLERDPRWKEALDKVELSLDYLES